MRESRGKNALVEGVNLGDEVRFRISPDVITATPPDQVISTSALRLHSSAPNGSIKASKLQPIVNQQGLVELSLSRRGLVVLPGDVLTLLRLEVLILCNNRLQVLPAEIGRLHKLRQLDVSRNSLLILPDTLLNLIHLVELNLSWNKLISLPHPLSQLKKLRVLRLAHNNFEVMPSTLGELTALRQLDISHNRLWHLPESCAALRHLNDVSLAGNIFDQLPVSLCEAEGIEILELQGNRLLNLPPHITKLRQLKVLNVSHNKLEAVPAPVTELAQLHTFNVSHNYLRSIPGELARLPNLKDLYARSNNITFLPNDLGNVQLLDVARNHLTNFSVAHMRQLRHLDCGHNVLENLPLGVYVLPHLEALKLNSNRISYVSQDIVLLRKLRILDLSHNCLTSLPNVIEEMLQLEAFNVRGNKLGKRPLVRTNKDTGGGIGDDGELQSQPYSFQRPYPSMYKKNQGLRATKGKWQKAHHKTPPVAPHSRPNSPSRWNPRGSVKARERPPLDYRPRSGSLSTLMAVTRPQKFSTSADDQVTNKRQVTQPSQVSIQQTNPIAEISYPQCNTAPGTPPPTTSTPVPPPRRKKSKGKKSKNKKKEREKEETDTNATTPGNQEAASVLSNAVTVNETVGDELSLGEEDFDLHPVTVKDERLAGVCVEVEGMLNSQMLQPIISARGIFPRKTVNENGTMRTLQALSTSRHGTSLSEAPTSIPPATSDDVIHMSKDIYLKRATAISVTTSNHATKIDTFTVTSAGGLFRSTVDPNVSVYFPVNAVDKPIALTMQIERVFLEALKTTSHRPLLDNLVAVAPIVHIQQSRSINFHHQATLTIPAPLSSHKGTLHLLTYYQNGMCAPCSSAYKVQHGYLTLQAWHFSGKGAVTTKSKCKYKACKSVESMLHELGF